MKHIFWIFFALEALMLLWSFRNEMMLSLPMPPYIPMGFIWLLLVLLVKFLIKSDKIALVMVAIPGVPVLLFLLFWAGMAIYQLFGGRIRLQ